MENQQPENQEIIQQPENQEILKPRMYNDLRLGEKIALNREYNRDTLRATRTLRWLMFFCVIITAVGGAFWMINLNSETPNAWQYHIGFLVFKFSFVIMQILIPLLFREEDKNYEKKGYFERYGKKTGVFLIISLCIVLMGNIVHIIYLFPSMHYKGLNIAQTIISWIGLVGISITLMIFLIKNRKKDREEMVKNDKKFCKWLKKEKNIIKENSIFR